MGESFKSKMPLYEANVLAEELKLDLLKCGVEDVVVCGSIRRKKPEVGDLDIVVVGSIDHLKDQPYWRYADGGKKKCTVEYKGRQVNIMATTFESVGAAMLYFTGSSTFNIILRRKAKKLGLKLNEYGLWKDEDLIANTERDIMEELGVEWHEPHERST